MGVMTTISETELPGVGTRYDLQLVSGRRIGVLAHRTGRRDLFVYNARDPDAVTTELSFTSEEGKVVADLLGGTRLVESVAQVQQHVEGLALDWLEIPASSSFAGRTIGDARVRTATGVSIVAVIRGEEGFPAPGPEFRFEAGDTAVVIGTADGIVATSSLLTS